MASPLIKSLLLMLVLCITGCGESVELHSRLAEQEANEVIAELAEKQVHAQKISTKSGISVRVNTQDISRAIKTLAAAGLPRAARSTLGEIFRKEGVISTPLEERARYIHALSQELEATLSNIDGVIVARVHVVLPERVAPGEAVQPASASVFIKHDARLDPDSIQPRVRRMVASSLPGMATTLDNPNNIIAVFVPAEAFQDKQQLAFFGPFLVPAQNLRFWKNTFSGAVFALLIAIITPVMWIKLRNKAPHSEEPLA